MNLNGLAKTVVDEALENHERLRLQAHHMPGGGCWIDCGLETLGGLETGLLISRVCLAGLGTVGVQSGSIGKLSWPFVQVQTDHPTQACLCSQYAGWRVSEGDFFGMLSGPIRAIAAREELFQKLDFQEHGNVGVGIFETDQAPTEAVFQSIATKANLSPEQIFLLVAPTSSQAGGIQIVARSVETAMHKIFELGFDVTRIQSGWGTAPLPPCGADFLTSLGRTNDAILYGGQVHLWVSGDPANIREIGPKVPADSSDIHGKPFREIFEEAGGDFYKIDPHLFSPAVVVFHASKTGEVFRFGQIAPDIVQKSFGLVAS